MSAALVILPVVWATEAPQSEAAHPKALHPEAASPAAQAAHAAHAAHAADTDARQAAPEMAFYRKYTEGMLRRYVKMSMEAGRAPSLLGKELFRGKVTNCVVNAFDDAVIFVHDVGRCLEMLDWGQQYLIRRIAMQEFTQAETAAITSIPLRTVHRRYAGALDVLTEIFLERKLLEPRTASQEVGSVR